MTIQYEYTGLRPIEETCAELDDINASFEELEEAIARVTRFAEETRPNWDWFERMIEGARRER